MPGDRVRGWLATLAVTAVAGALRFYKLSFPHADVFDEVYYHWEAVGLLKYGVEREKPSFVGGHLVSQGADFVVHPPLGKWAIAAGIQIFGNTSFGYRFSAAVAGTLAVLLMIRLARRMFRSTVLGCLAGLLFSLDGMEFVQSRVAMLDIFQLVFEVAALACLVADRDDGRRRLADRMTPEAAGSAAAWPGPRLGIRWWRVGCGFFLGCVVATKWDGGYILPVFAILALAWDCGARRSAGFRAPVRAALRRSWAGWVPSFVVVPAVVYTVSWTGWFLSTTQYAYDRHYDGRHGIIGSLLNWWQYHREAFQFATNLTTVAHCLGGKLNAAHDACVGGIGTFYAATHHPYESYPFGWLVVARPVAYYYESPKIGHAGCRAAGGCAQEIMSIGTPALWWVGTVALVVALGIWVARRDWRAGLIAVSFAALWLPWFASITRVMFDYYILPGLPFLVLALTMIAGLLIARWPVAGTIGVAVYTLIVVINFAWLYPVLTGETLSLHAWNLRIWFPGWV
jgi:dolichyl-phosphate-mannose--protein O-mannosyl transferase